MHLAVAVGENGFFLDPGEVALTLIRGHGAADFVKVLQHLFLALGAKLSGFGKGFLDFRGDRVRGGEETLQLLAFQVDPVATFHAARKVGFVHFADPLEFGSV